jgi:hypothetical protein
VFPIQIITDKARIETSPDKVFRVLPGQKQAFKERIYALECGQAVYEIYCPEIQEDGVKYLIVPEFMIPGRPYPIYVYLYAIVLYSSNPEMGQREAAEKTRKRFGLTTFSHTTLGRAMKTVEALVKTDANEPELYNDTKEPQQPDAGRFPSVELTAKRREMVLSYLNEASGQDGQLAQEPSQPKPSYNYTHPPYVGPFIDACHKVVDYTFKKYCRFLL